MRGLSATAELFVTQTELVHEEERLTDPYGSVA